MAIAHRVGERRRLTDASAGSRARQTLVADLEDQVLLAATYWHTNLTLRQLAPLFGVSKSAADRIIDHTAPLLALQPRRRYRKDTVLIVDGTLVPTDDLLDISCSGVSARALTSVRRAVRNPPGLVAPAAPGARRRGSSGLCWPGAALVAASLVVVSLRRRSLARLGA